MDDRAAIRARAEALFAVILASGAQRVEADSLLPAETLLDLYGEDIRARAYVTHDALRGEMMLRPDFTVPVVQTHMAQGADPARYCYLGSVYRQQYQNSTRHNEYLQVGYEVFDAHDPLGADAEVFAMFARLFTPYKGVRAAIGDIGILRAAIHALGTSEARKAALLRHIWRPKRFRALLDRFAENSPQTPERRALLAKLAAQEDVLAGTVHTGLRSVNEIKQRLEALQADAATPPISPSDVAQLHAVLDISDNCPRALEKLTQISSKNSPLAPALAQLKARVERLEKAGVDIDTLTFEASYGRTSMEYYDGFVFGFYLEGAPDDMPALASGGRYDALTRVLGDGASIPAVGGAIRPALLVAAQPGGQNA